MSDLDSCTYPSQPSTMRNMIIEIPLEMNQIKLLHSYSQIVHMVGLSLLSSQQVNSLKISALKVYKLFKMHFFVCVCAFASPPLKCHFWQLIHPSTHLRPLIRAPVTRAAALAGKPRLLYRSYFIQLFQRDPKAFPGQPWDAISPAWPGSSWGPPAGGMCPENLTRGVSWKHPARCLNQLIWLRSMWRSSGWTCWGALPDPQDFVIPLKVVDDVTMRETIETINPKMAITNCKSQIL